MPQTLNWIVDHFHLLRDTGILATCGVLIKILWSGGGIFTNAKARILTAETNLNHSTTNCIPTIQANTEATNSKLDKQTELLENIDKNIAILVDRGR